jgi:hypothetical protein
MPAVADNSVDQVKAMMTSDKDSTARTKTRNRTWVRRGERVMA